MKNTFALGAIAGITTLGLAVPLLAQISSAQSVPAGTTPTTSSAKPWAMTRPIPTQAQVTDMATKDGAFLTNVDALVTVEKTAVQTHEAALTAAAAITDDTAREAAVQKANQDERTAIQAAITANANLKSGMMPFGGGRGFGGRGMGMMGGQNMAALATKLGMTEADLQAAIKGGQTIQQIAAAKGVTLPTPPMRGHGRPNDNDADDVSTGSSTSATTSASAQ